MLTQFDKNDVETIGLVKFDFLGLRTLTIIHEAVKAINIKLASNGESMIDIHRLPLDDKATYVLLKQCNTTALFQLESRGMTDLIRRLQPDNFDDVMALVALFRPGPLQSGMVDTFIACKHGKQAVHYPDPRVEPILRPTYGVILYQEQVMQIAQVLAEYSLGGADVLRHAMGKKKAREMAKQRAVFIEGAIKNRLNRQQASDIFDLIEKFAGYGFNKSHSAAYALIAYQTAWLKAHYPAEFMASVLSADMDNTDKIASLVEAVRKMGLIINLPNIHTGSYSFIVNALGAIEYGLGAIKGVGAAVIEHIIAVRASGGRFLSFFDFMHRIDCQKVTRRALEPLVHAGAMDSFGISRAVLAATMGMARQGAEQQQRRVALGQHDLFGAEAVREEAQYAEVEEWTEQERLRFEKEALGLYFSGHPMQVYASELDPVMTVRIGELSSVQGQRILIAGLVMGIRRLLTRRGKRMAVLTFEDQTGRTEVMIFPKLYASVGGMLMTDSILIIEGQVKADEYTGQARIIADQFMPLQQFREQFTQYLLIDWHPAASTPVDVPLPLQRLSAILQPYQGGRCPVVLGYHNASVSVKLLLSDAWKIKPQEDLLQVLQKSPEWKMLVAYPSNLCQLSTSLPIH